MAQNLISPKLYYILTKDSNEPHEEAHKEVHPMGTLGNQVSIAIVTGTGIGIELVLHLTTVPRLKIIARIALVMM